MPAVTIIKFISAMLLLGLLILFTLDLTVAELGVCYGRLGDNLPPPSEVVALYSRNNIKRMRIYNPDQSILQALSGSNIEVMLGVPNRELEKLAATQSNANAWIKNNIRNYPNVRFRYIAVGNEINATEEISPLVLPALRNVYIAVSVAGLGNQIRVSTAIETGGLALSFLPANAVFRPDVASFLNPIIQFLVNTSAPLFVNIFPYFAYIDNPRQIDIQDALLQRIDRVVMPGDQTVYQSLFSAMLDAIYAALEKSGGSSLELVVSETGWPSAGEDDAATVENARIYNTNLIALVKYGTPRRPGRPIETYIYSMFDENMKIPTNDEKHFGIFLLNGQPKYQIFLGTLNSTRISARLMCVFVA